MVRSRRNRWSRSTGLGGREHRNTRLIRVSTAGGIAPSFHRLSEKRFEATLVCARPYNELIQISSINFLSIANFDDVHNQLVILNFVNNAIATLSHPVIRLPGEFLAARWTRVCC